MFYKIYGVSVGSRKVIFFLASQLPEILIKHQALIHFSFLVTHSIWRYSCLDDSDASNLLCMSHPKLPGLLQGDPYKDTLSTTWFSDSQGNEECIGRSPSWLLSRGHVNKLPLV